MGLGRKANHALDFTEVRCNLHLSKNIKQSTIPVCLNCTVNFSLLHPYLQKDHQVSVGIPVHSLQAQPAEVMAMKGCIILISLRYHVRVLKCLKLYTLKCRNTKLPPTGSLFSAKRQDALSPEHKDTGTAIAHSIQSMYLPRLERHVFNFKFTPLISQPYPSHRSSKNH